MGKGESVRKATECLGKLNFNNMEKEIQNIETALIIIAEAIEAGEWQGLENDVRKILGWEEWNDQTKKPRQARRPNEKNDRVSR